jgi:hypothetical protein
MSFPSFAQPDYSRLHPLVVNRLEGDVLAREGLTEGRDYVCTVPLTDDMALYELMFPGRIAQDAVDAATRWMSRSIDDAMFAAFKPAPAVEVRPDTLARCSRPFHVSRELAR